MKLDRFIAACLALFFISFQSMASPAAGRGNVEMKGSIVTATCDISTSADEQIVDLGMTTIGRFIRNGKLYQHKLDIKLQNCSDNLMHERYQIAFNGDSDGKYFKLNGDIEGVALQIVDAAGNVAMPGIPLPVSEIPTDNNIASFYLRFIGNGDLKAGMFSTTVLFNLRYF